MRKLFVCLANSKKHGERCIAGIELVKNAKGRLNIVRHADQRPKWIRPVTETENGEVPEKLVKDIQLLDILEVDVLRNCPNSYQKENALFDKKSLRKLSQLPAKSAYLSKLLDPTPQCLFGNFGKAVIQEKVAQLDYSLALVKVHDARVFKKGIKEKKRLRFCYHHKPYDFPITDISFLDRFFEDETILENYHDLFLAISLSVGFEGWHYKLAAGLVATQE